MGKTMMQGVRRAGWVLGLGAVMASLPAEATAQEVDPGDVESIDAIMAAVYDVISGPAGQARDWDRMRSLFLPEAQLIPSGVNPEGKHGYQVMSVDDYITNAGAWLEENGFFEVEINRVTEQFGDIAHAFSTYESYRTEGDAEPFMRGINSFQLMFDEDRWWVVSIYWQGESESSSIPSKYGG